MNDLHAYPANVTFRDLIARNRRNSVWLVILMAGLFVMVGVGVFAGVMAYSGSSMSGPGLAIAAGCSLAVAGISVLWSYYGGAGALLAISHAVPIEKADDPQLFNIVEELSIAAGLPVPRVYLMQSPALNAFATGRDPKHAAVAITTGLRERLTRDELMGVMAHEMAHIRHYDIRLTMLVATLAGLIVLACDLFWHQMRWGHHRGGRSSDRERGGGWGAVVFMVLAVLLALLAPLLARLIQLAVSRQREYLADAGAVELTRNPQGLIDALRKLGADMRSLDSANRATAHLYIVNPILNAAGQENLDSAFTTHPPLAKRIARLQALQR